MAEETKSSQSKSKNETFDQKDIDDNKVMAAMSYLWILVFVPLFLKKDSKFVQFHAKQGLVLFMLEIAVSFVNVVPFLGQLVWFFASIAFLLISILGIIKALGGEGWKMPYIYDWGKKINL